MALVKTSILPRVPKPCLTHGFPTENMPTSPGMSGAYHAWVFFWSPLPHTMSAVLTWPLQSPIPLLPEMCPAPYHIAHHQGSWLVALPSMPQHFFLESPAASQILGIKTHMARGSLPSLSFSAELSFLILHLAESLSIPKHAPPNWPWGLCTCCSCCSTSLLSLATGHTFL